MTKLLLDFIPKPPAKSASRRVQASSPRKAAPGTSPEAIALQNSDAAAAEAAALPEGAQPLEVAVLDRQTVPLPEVAVLDEAAALPAESSVSPEAAASDA